MLGRIIRFVALSFAATVVASTIGAMVARNRVVARGGPADDEVALATIMDEVNFKSTAKAFRGGSALLWMSGGDIDLRGATLDPAGATLRITTIMGGGRILVPSTWRVTTNLVAIMGGIVDSRGVDDDALPVDAPRLDLRGWLFMGGFGLATEDEGTEADKVAKVVVKTAGKKNGKTADVVESGAASA
ncbi:MAG TPA: hypothetical protein VJZ72_06920 [Candidatus Limnocylindrales bacterium]|nr:hypothetical protein [Candidatus Limnocylindrales bacterium]